MVPPRWAMPRTESRVRMTTSSSPSRPAKPRFTPSTSHPRLSADNTAARMTAFRPGASPPPVEMAIRIDDRREERIRIGTAAPPVRQKNEQDAAAQRKSACDAPSPSFSASPASLSLAASGEQFQHLAGLSVSSGLRFLEDRSAVLEHFKPATLRWDELHIGV